MDSRALKSLPAGTQGFTLIELMVAITVSLFITGAVIVNYNSYNATQALKQAALTVKNDFRLVQSKAASGQKPSGCGTLVGWNINFAASSYSLQANCNNVPTGTASSINLPPGITFQSVPSTNPITVYVLSHGTNLPSTLTLTLLSSGNQYSVQINPAGDVSDLGLQH